MRGIEALVATVVLAILAESGHAFSSIAAQPSRLTATTSSTNLQAQLNPWDAAKKAVAGVAVASTLFLSQPAVATEASIVGQIQGSGLVFKDILQIERFDDPKVKGVTLYVSNFQRPLTERLTSNFLADPSYASVSCARTGPVSIADNINKSKGGEQVFDESRSIFFKTLRVQRIYDEEKNTVVYVSFNTRLDKGDDSNKSRFKSSLCAVNLDDFAPATTMATAAPATDGK
mmetsp:Transcript_33340/g.69451  ORF Transcript_33340/g.69451 Transcript_33340/m.69451 type:complete len:231 (+) Transcript_33340:33-725(+)